MKFPEVRRSARRHCYDFVTTADSLIHWIEDRDWINSGESQPVSPDLQHVDLKALIGHTTAVQAEAKLEDVYQLFEKNNFAFIAVLENERFIGMCSRWQIGMLLGSRYGFSLFSRKSVRDPLLTDALVVSIQSPLDSVLEQVDSRGEQAFYDDVVLVNEQGSFLGLIFTRTLVQLQYRFLRQNIKRLEEKQREINRSGAALQADSEAAGVSEFLRPEDGAWSKDGTKFYVVTTDRYDQVKDGIGTQVARSRLWSLAFDDITNPENGGDITLLLDGTEAVNMMDNLTVDASTGNILIAEDVGGQAHNGKLWLYRIGDGSLIELAKHDAVRFGDIGQGANSPFNNDEEFSGIIDVTSIMSSSTIPGASEGSWYLMDDQAHYTGGTSSAQVEGGQLLLVHAIPEPSTCALLTFGMAGALTMMFRRRWQA